MSKLFTDAGKRGSASTVLAFLIAFSATGLGAQTPASATDAADQKTNETKFYCNAKALSPVERARHYKLTEKLMGARKEVVETPKGYEFQFSPSDVSLAELAEWVADEGKCCRFLDFHIDLEAEGNLLCLRLTGKEGIKPFIRSEFQVPETNGRN